MNEATHTLETATATLAEADRQYCEAVDMFCDAAKDLPDNPRITRLGKNCFTMKASDLGRNWSAEYHDFKVQYRHITDAMRKAGPGKALTTLTGIVEAGRIRMGGSAPWTINLHPDVVKNLTAILPKEA